jgi:hypothetical protein
MDFVVSNAGCMCSLKWLILGSTKRESEKRGSPVHYEEEKAMQRELNERIPPAPKGDPQNELRQVVNSQRFHGMSFDQSVTIAVSVIRKRYPLFTPRILPPRQAHLVPAERRKAATSSR